MLPLPKWQLADYADYLEQVLQRFDVFVSIKACGGPVGNLSCLNLLRACKLRLLCRSRP